MTLEGINLSQFKILNLVGSGQFGEVFKIVNNKTNDIFAAKISLRSFDSISSDAKKNFQREVNIIAKLNHPGIIKFIGFSPTNFQGELKPLIITEFLSNGSLKDLIELERRSLSNKNWDDTRKLIIIYGIASAMAYLHSHGIIHRDLKPENILIDDYLFPKICDFGLSKIINKSPNFSKSSSDYIKGTPIYMAPEIFSGGQYNEASDVYAFSLIMYEIITTKEPFKDSRSFYNDVMNGKRPNFPFKIPESYQELIEKCWSQDADERPTFSEIIQNLRKNSDFITDSVCEDDYLNYIDYIDECKISFHSSKKIISIDEFNKSRSKTIEKVSFKNLIKQKVPSSYPRIQFNQLSKECKKLILEAEDDVEKQFEIAKYHIEGDQNFPQNTEIGIFYLKKSIKEGCINSVVYYCNMLIKGEIIPQNFEKAKKLLEHQFKSHNSFVYLLYGKIMKKEGNYQKAIHYFLKSSNYGNGEAMYEYGKLLYKGKGCEKDKQKAIKLFEMSKKNKCMKSDNFLAKQKKITSKDSDIKHRKKRSQSLIVTDDSDDEITTIEKDKEKVKQTIDYNYLNALKILNGKETTQNFSMAAKLLKKSADNGNIYAMNNYAFMLQNGQGVSINFIEAAKYYKKAADKGFIDSMNNYAFMLQNGKGVSINYIEAAKYYKAAADQGHVLAMNNYALMLQNGQGFPIDYYEASKYYKMSADKGFLEAINNYGCIHEYLSPPNYFEATKYYKIAADQGHILAMSNYAINLQYGRGVPVNFVEAAKYYKIAADKGNILAMNNYAILLQYGQGVPINCVKAAKYYKKAADKGFIDSMNNYAILLQYGQGVPINFVEAAKYYKMAADKGHVLAMNSYGCLLQNNYINVPNKYEEAAKYYKMAAERGHVPALNNFGWLLEVGCGVPINKNKAIKYLKIAADKGDSVAMTNVGIALLNRSKDEGKNIKEAIEYFKKAAQFGSLAAMNWLGHIFQHGIENHVDYNQALFYYKMAADKGCPFSMKDYADLLLKLAKTVDQQKEAFFYFKMAASRGVVSEKSSFLVNNKMADNQQKKSNDQRNRLNSLGGQKKQSGLHQNGPLRRSNSVSRK